VYARFIASFCLLYVSAVFGFAGSLQPASNTVVVYLKTDASSSQQKGSVVDIMKRELTTEMQQVGYDVEWADAAHPSFSTSAPLIVADLRGTCVLPSRSDSSQNAEGKQLAASQVAGERIEPFISLNCDTLNSFLSSTASSVLMGPAGPVRDYTYGRAMARLLAHELYHVLAQTSHHSKTGVARANVTPAELLADRFDFDDEAAQRLHAALHSSPANDNVKTATAGTLRGGL
jgi:hypothetical protein